MSQKINYEEYANQFLTQLPKGAFLTVKSGDNANTMTIGWGSTGYIWQRPVMMVMVRYSRHTHGLIDKAQDFSISIPAPGQQKKALATAGTRSGRDIDKFKECGLSAETAQVITSPVIGECDLIYECKLIFKQAMNPDNLDQNIKDKYYDDNDFHVMYFGEIVSCYKQK